MNMATGIHHQGAGLLNAFFGKGHDNGLHLGQFKAPAENPSGGGVSVSLSLSEVSLSVHGRGIKILGHELEARFEGVGVAKNDSVASMPVFEPPSPEEVAGKVLGFVEKRLQLEAEGGASQERLSDLLGQARKGVEQGFSEARSQIESLGLMSDSLNDEIGKSFDLISEGLDGFEEKYLGNASESDETVATSAGSDSESVPSRNSASPDQGDAGAVVEGRGHQSLPGVYRFGASAFSGQNNSASIEITTRDGDKVKIQAANSSAGYFEFNQASGPRGSSTQLSAGYMQSASFGLSIDGELDEGEMTALQDLLAQVQSLSDQFFGGDFQGAFENAMKLGFDGNEIADFSLNLSQSQVRQVSAYEQVSRLGQSEHAGSGRGAFKPLADFASAMGQASAKAEHFAEPAKLLRDFLDQMAPPANENADILAHSHQDFFAKLLEKIAA